MRKSITAILIVLFAMTGCSLLEKDEEFDPGAKPEMAVIMRQDATKEQQETIAAAVRELPGFDSIRFETPREAYDKAVKLNGGTPLPGMDVRYMPPSWLFTTTDLRAWHQLKDSPELEAVKKLPGAAEVAVPVCATRKECAK